MQRSDGSGRKRWGFGIALIVLGVMSFLSTAGSEIRDSKNNDTVGRGEDFASASGLAMVNTAIRQMKDNVTSLRLTGLSDTEADKANFDVVFDVDGRCQVQFAEGAGRRTFIFDGDDAYVKANAAGWRQLTGTNGGVARGSMRAVGTKWALVARSDVAGNDRLCDFGEFFGAMDRVSDTADFEVKGEEKIGQKRVMHVVSRWRSTGRSVSFWLAIEEPHHIVRFTIRSRDTSRDITFSEINQPRKNFKPAKGDVQSFR